MTHPLCTRPSSMIEFSHFLERAIIFFEHACRRAHQFATSDDIVETACKIAVLVSSRATYGARTTPQHNPELTLGLALSSDHVDCKQLHTILKPSLIAKAKASVAHVTLESREATAASVERIVLWLSKNPHELNKAKSDAAAFKVLAHLCVDRQVMQPNNLEKVHALVASHLKRLVDSAINAVDAQSISIFTERPDRTPMFYALIVSAVRTLEHKFCASRTRASKPAERDSTTFAGRTAIRRAEARGIRNLRAAKRNANSATEEADAMKPLPIGPSRRTLQKKAHHRRFKQQCRMLKLERGKHDTKPKRWCNGRKRDRDTKFFLHSESDDAQ